MFSQGNPGGVPRTPAAHSTPEGGEGSAPKPFPSRTYHTIKDMISSRFNKRSDKVEELRLVLCYLYHYLLCYQLRVFGRKISTVLKFTNF